MILLDNCGPFRWLTFPNYGCAVTIPIAVIIAVARANRYASTHGSNAYTHPNVISQRGGSKRRYGGHKQSILLHVRSKS